MKKIIAILAAVATVAATLAFAGCTNNEVIDNNEVVEGEVKGDENAEGDVVEGETEKALTVAEGKLTMATNAYFRPYEFYEGDKIVGIDAEIAEAIAAKLGLELVIEDMEFNSIITAVQSGAVDMGVAGMTVTEERRESVNFSSSYANGVQSVIVKEGSDITVDSLFVEGATIKAGVMKQFSVLQAATLIV